jgi:hypothetical protein
MNLGIPGDTESLDGARLRIWLQLFGVEKLMKRVPSEVRGGYFLTQSLKSGLFIGMSGGFISLDAPQLDTAKAGAG